MRAFRLLILFSILNCSLQGQGTGPAFQILVTGYHCADSSLAFSFFHPQPQVSMEWNFGDGRKETSANPRFTFPAAGSYLVTLMVADNFDRRDTASLMIDIFDCQEPVTCLDNDPLDIGTVGALCADSLVEFYAVTALPLIYYRWESAGELKSFAASWGNVFRDGELADIRLVATDARGCIYEGPLVTRVNECLPYCPDTVMVEVAGALCADSLLRLSAVSEASLAAWQWEIDGNLVGSNAALKVILPPGPHQVRLMASDGRDCTYQTERELTIALRCEEDYRCRLGFPTAFSPNGDGINDTFGPVNFCPVTAYEFLVFNRWGVQVFSTRDPADAWDGAAGGEDLPSGMYLWMARYQTPEGEAVKESGGVVMVK